MSRLIIKNLPKSVSADNLNKVFSEKGEVTDVQLKYTKDGKFRHFAFIGFRTEEQAKEAQEYFNGTCIKSNKVTVEICASLGDINKPKAWSKYSSDSSAYKKIHGLLLKTSQIDNTKTPMEKRKKNEAKLKELLHEHINDPLFLDFLEAHSGNKIVKEVLEKANDESINNDEYSDDESVGKEDTDEREKNDIAKKKTETQSIEKIANKSTISDMDYMKLLMAKKTETNPDDATEKSKEEIEKKKLSRNRELLYVKINGLPFKCKKKDIKDFFRPLIPYTIRIPKSKKLKGFCYVGFRKEEELNKALQKNRMILSGNRISVYKYTRKEQETEEKTSKYNDFKTKEANLQNEESIAESGCIFVRNLPYITTEDELQKLFDKYGPVVEVDMPIDKVSRKPKGFALVTFMMPEHAVTAYSELDGTIFSGRMLHLLPGKQNKTTNDDDVEGLSFKEKKARQQKNQAKSSHNWNTLFLGTNAIADVVAETYHTTKEQLLHDSDKNSSAAVRLALGETQLVSTTRKFLEENGVYLDAFSKPPSKRSKTIILVKNLPSNTTIDEVRILFQSKGELARLIMPPHGITALVEFVEPSEARNAFVKLAYSQFKNLPLYLEWAPDDVFSRRASKDENIPKLDTPIHSNMKEEPAHESSEVTEIPEDITDYSEPESETVLFIKNINFQSVEDSIREHFKRCGQIFKVTIARKKDPQNPGKFLSMGYGFIQFYTKKATEKALKEMQMTILDGKTIELKRSERTGLGDVRTNKKSATFSEQTGSKILVRNVPFQAKREEIYEIFRTFGEIKTLRLPKKLTPGEDRHRGFCFVDFYTNADAKSAFDALCHSTHLYGRRMILEWAAQTDEATADVDDLRKRTAQTYNQPAPGGKKTKKSFVDLETLNNDID